MNNSDATLSKPTEASAVTTVEATTQTNKPALCEKYDFRPGRRRFLARREKKKHSKSEEDAAKDSTQIVKSGCTKVDTGDKLDDNKES